MARLSFDQPFQPRTCLTQTFEPLGVLGRGFHMVNFERCHWQSFHQWTIIKKEKRLNQRVSSEVVIQVVVPATFVQDAS